MSLATITNPFSSLGGTAVGYNTNAQTSEATAQDAEGNHGFVLHYDKHDEPTVEVVFTAASATVFANGQGITRIGDTTTCQGCGMTGSHVAGSPNVFVGD